MASKPGKRKGARARPDPRVARQAESLGLLKNRVLGLVARISTLESDIAALYSMIAPAEMTQEEE